MAANLRFVGMVALLHLATSNSVHISSSGGVADGEANQQAGHKAPEPALQISPSGAILNVQKEGTPISTATLMRSEVKRHSPVEASARLMGLLEAGEVNCSELDQVLAGVHGKDLSEAESTGKLCHILAGNNSQVAGKLERAVKGLSLRPKTANGTEMIVADKDMDRYLSHLKAAMWDMWFCAKRDVPPCDVMNSDEPKIQAARKQAFDSLHDIHAHSEEKPSTVHEAVLAATIPAKTSLLQIPEAGPSEYATKVLEGMLKGKNVSGNLWDSIHAMNKDVNTLEGMGALQKDEDGQMKKLKTAMLLLHECASMPACSDTATVAGCCNPKNPAEAKYIKARNDAYIAYHEIQEDDSESKQAYVKLLKNVGDDPPKSNYMPSDRVELQGPGYPGHNITKIVHDNHTEIVTETKDVVVPPVIVEEGSSTLLYAIIAVTVVVVLAIAYLVVKTNELSGGGAGGKAEHYGGQEQYGGQEGWGEGAY